MKNLIAVAAMTVLVSAPLVGNAQIPSMSGFGQKSAGGPDLSASQTGLVHSYVAANKDVLYSQSKLLEALGLKDQAGIAQATADSLGDGATKGNLADADKVQSNDSAALQAAVKAPIGTLDAQSKQTYTQGLVLLASGLVKYTGMRQDATAFGNGLSGASVLQVPKLQAGAYIVKSLPGNTVNLSETLKSAVAFANSHGIEVPPVANSVI
jgi:hypothetical protein